MLWKGVHGRAKLTGAWWPESEREEGDEVLLSLSKS